MGYFLKLALKSIAIAVLAAILSPAISIAAAQPAKKKGFQVPTPVKTEHGEPVTVTGQETIYDSKTDTFVVKGDAVMTQGGTVLKADEIDIMRRDRKATAIGHVHLIDPEVEMWATKGTIDITNETMVLYNAKILAKKDIYHLEGKQITKLEGQTYEVKDGFFTTCGCEKGTPSWSINAKQMVVNMGQTGHATNATFNVAGYPVIPTPYLPFPADSSRHSGLLSGREGESGLRGFQWFQPYYLVINKSSDATFAFDVETRQRIGGMAEYRLTAGKDDYLVVDGGFYDESIRSEANRIGDITDTQIADPHIPVDRYGIIAMGRQHITDDLIAYGDANSVSDSLYLREMDVWTLSRGFGGNFRLAAKCAVGLRVARSIRKRVRAGAGHLESGSDSAAGLCLAAAAGWDRDRTPGAIQQPDVRGLRRRGGELLPLSGHRRLAPRRQSAHHAAVAMG